MTRWLWYSNAAIIIIAVLVLVIGFSHLSALGPDGTSGGGKSGLAGGDKGGLGGGGDDKSESDSPLIAITRHYSERWMPAQGSLKVTIGPEAALKTQPKWKVDNSSWFDSGAKVDNIAAGAHTVSFKPAVDWVAPKNVKVTVSRKQLSEITANYSPPPPMGLLKVTFGPAEAVEAKGQWRVAKRPWQNSDAILDKIPVGSCGVEFKQLTFWETPGKLSVEISEDKITEATADYVKKPTGFVQVTIEPNEVLSAQPQWRVDNGAWLETGAKSGEILAGAHTIEFKAVAKWDTPGKITVDITQDQTIEIVKEYVRIPVGALQVAIGPPEAVDAKAQWRVGTGAWLDSGQTLGDLAVGSQAVELKTITGWDKPKKLTVTIVKDETATATYNYSKPKPPPPKFALEATMIIGQYPVLAWIKLPTKKKSQPFAIGEKIEQYRLVKIIDGSIELDREGHLFTLAVPEPKVKPSTGASKSVPPKVKKPPPRRPPRVPGRSLSGPRAVGVPDSRNRPKRPPK